MPWYLYLALKQLFPTGKKFPFFTAISVLGVALGVALLVISTSVMGGFGHQYRRMIVDTQGDVQVRARGFINDAAGLQARLAAVPGVVATTPFAEGVTGLIHEGRPAYPAMQGIDVANGALWFSCDDAVHGIYRADVTTGETIQVGSVGHLEAMGTVMPEVEGIDASQAASGFLHILTNEPLQATSWVDDLTISGP